MARRAVSDEDRARFWEAINSGSTQANAAKVAGVSVTTATNWMRAEREKNRDLQTRAQQTLRMASGGIQRDQAKADLLQAEFGGPIPYEQLCPEAKKAWHDFGYFRERYLGRVTLPWHRDAAQRIGELLASPEREFGVINVAPGVGKSTLFLDFAVWSIVRNRAIRILMGSISKPLADQYAASVRTELERPFPFRPSTDLVRKGLACDAVSTLARDYGRFKPVDKGGLWRRDEFVVEQFDGNLTMNKEPTVSAYGLDSEFIGHRADLCFFDDMVNNDNAREGAAHDRLVAKWDAQAEARCEPGGALFLIGQRIGPTDLYHHCINKVAYDDEEMDEDGNPVEHRRYHHIVYKAYHEDLDTGPESRKPMAPAWPNGPLLDPQRLPWRDLNYKKQSTPDVFAISYQQEDLDASMSLVQRVWAMGGTDKATGITYPGCIDHGRLIREIPVEAPMSALSVASVDPSPSENWGIEWWLHDPNDPQGRRWLLDLERKRQTAEELLGWDTSTQQWVGLMEDWQLASEQAGRRITHWIVEVNAAQRFLLAHDYVRRWQQARRVLIVPHQTHKNKNDENRGVEALLKPIWRHGQVRLPDFTCWQTQALVNEATSWKPDKKKGTDLVMAQWFTELHWPKVGEPKRPPVQKRPSWMLNREFARV